MKQLIGVLGWLGVALVASAFTLWLVKPEMYQLRQYLAISGLIVTLIYALTQWRDINRSFQGKNVKYGSVATGGILLFVAMLVGINYIANRQNKRWDLTENQQFSLGEQTKQIVRSLKSPLNIKVFHASNDSPQRYRDRFSDYQYLSSQISIEYINAEGKPTEAEKYEVVAYPTFIMEYEGRTQRATTADEQAITNTLKKLMEGKAKKAYFIQGHGERDPDDASTGRGYKGASNSLLDENFEVAKLTLAQAGSIPADATVVIVAGATIDFLPKEVELLTAFLKGGGKLLLMIDPPEKGGTVQPASLIALAKAWGIQVGEDIVVDPRGQMIGADASVPVGMPTQHAISAPLRGVAMAFSLARSVTAIEGGAEGKFAQSITETGPESWAESDVKGLYATQRPEKNTDKGDKAGPVSIGAAVSAAADAVPPPAPSPSPSPSPSPEATPAPDAMKPESRLVVIGDSDFASNRWIGQLGNSNLFTNVGNWLAKQEDFISIRQRDPEDRRIELTSDRLNAIRWATLLVIPLLLFGNAVRMYRKRR